MWDRSAGPFSPEKRAQQEPAAGHSLALRRRSRAALAPDHRSDPRHAAGAGQGEADPRGTRELEAGLLSCSHEREFRGTFGHQVRSAAEGRTARISCRASWKHFELRITVAPTVVPYGVRSHTVL
jgi:hypothetical protein